MPPPVAVKNAGMPDPPARIRSASVPCGVSSTSSSPERYCRANSLFSPTYDEIIRRSRFSISSRPRPHSSTPQLFDTASQVGHPRLQQRVDQHRRDAAQPEPADRQRRTVLDVGHRFAPADDLVHASVHSEHLRDRVILPPSRAATDPGLPPGGYAPSRHACAVPTSPASKLHVVTGKGGTGKTTVAASLALALASHGQDVLLCEVEGRQGIARLFDVDPLPYEERRIAVGLPRPGDRRPGTVYGLHIDPESALLEYLAMYYKLGRAGRALDRFGVDRVRDHARPRRARRAAHRQGVRGREGGPPRSSDSRQYDAVVLDAPPTGRIAQFLGVNSELAGLARMGPIKSQADQVMKLFRSPRTAIHLVTVLEEMPVQETTDGIAELRGRRAAGGRGRGQHGPAAGPRRRRPRGCPGRARSTRPR